MIKILIVDDSATIQKLMEFALDNPIIQRSKAKNGGQALEMLERESFDLVITDVVMPEMDGYALAEAIQQNQSYSDLAVVFLRGRFQSFDAERAKKLGVEHFLEKPFSQPQLVKIIETSLGLEPNELLSQFDIPASGGGFLVWLKGLFKRD